jgi:regulator of sigma E protease
MLDLPNWLLIIPVLASLIFVHELGHFVTAKLFHIKVTEFGFGFPPRIYGIPFRGTIYSINLIPMGGFVRMVGEEDPTDPESFARQSIYKRLTVLAAGSAMNIALPIVIFTVLLMLPHDSLVGGSVLITGVAPGSPAERAGLRSGDTIISVDGKPVISPTNLIDVVKGKSGRPIELSLRRASRVTGLGTSPEFATFDIVVVEPRARPPSLKVVEEVTDPKIQVSLAEARKYNRALSIGDTMTQGAIGVMIGLVNPKYGQTSDPIWKAVPNSIKTVWSVLTFTWEGISEAVSTGSNPGLAGPVGIAKATGEVVEQLGVSWVFQLAAILSISLAIINMLPFPALDGGRFTFVVIEWVRRGKRISPQKEGMVHLVGFVLLIGLIVVITYFDILKIMSGESFLR